MVGIVTVTISRTGALSSPPFSSSLWGQQVSQFNMQQVKATSHTFEWDETDALCSIPKVSSSNCSARSDCDMFSQTDFRKAEAPQ